MRPTAFLALALSLLSALPSRGAEPARLRIAVLPFTNKILKDPPDRKLFEDAVKGIVARTLPDAGVIDRLQVYELLQSALGADGVADKCEELCVRERAMIIGADYSVDGTLTPLGDFVVLTLNLIETTSGSTVSNQITTGRTPADLILGDLTVAVTKLLLPITEKSARAEAKRKEAERKETEAREAKLRELEQQNELTVRQKELVVQQKELERATRGRVWTWVAGGTAVVALGLGGVFGAQSKSTSADIADNLHTRQEQDALRTQYESQAGRANLMLGIGVALAAVTGTFFVLRF